MAALAQDLLWPMECGADRSELVLGKALSAVAHVACVFASTEEDHLPDSHRFREDERHMEPT